MAIRLFPNRKIIDDTGRSVPATGELLGQCLSLTGFSIGRSDDPGVLPPSGDSGKKKMVSLIAAIRKLLVILNAMLREQKAWRRPTG